MEDLIECSQCKGKGNIYLSSEEIKTKKPIKRTCPKCSGFGKLDWIENVVGTNIKVENFTVLNETNSDITIQDLGIIIRVGIEFKLDEILPMAQISESKDLIKYIRTRQLRIVDWIIGEK